MQYKARTVAEYKARIGIESYHPQYAGKAGCNNAVANKVAALDNPGTLHGCYIYIRGILYRLWNIKEKEAIKEDDLVYNTPYEFLLLNCRPQIEWISEEALDKSNVVNLLGEDFSFASGEDREILELEFLNKYHFPV